MDFEKFIKNLPFRFFFFFPHRLLSIYLTYKCKKGSTQQVEPVAQETILGDSFARQEALLQGILHSITAWLNLNFIVMRFAMLDRGPLAF